MYQAAGTHGPARAGTSTRACACTQRCKQDARQAQPTKGGCLTWTGICCSRPSFSGSCMYSCIEAAYPTSCELTRQVVSWYVPAKPQHKAGHARLAAQAAVLSPLVPKHHNQPSLPAAAACRPAARGGQTAGQLHPPEAGCTTIAGVAWALPAFLGSRS